MRPAELEMGSGMGLDIAFQTSMGRWDVPVAVMDSGIVWSDNRLSSKILLNQAELPRPRRADGTEVLDGDLDGNGLHNLDDWREDARIDITSGVDEADGMLDPSDLIATFSNDVDDDGNGFTDDIAGWDFLEDDNDPYARLAGLYTDHGTGVMRAIGEAANDGSGVGVCPNCAILPVRIGDAFIGHGDAVGMAMAYAISRDVKVINMSLGAMSWPAWGRELIAYGGRHGVSFVGVAADENAYHHNFPAAVDGVIMVHGVRAGSQSEGRNVGSYLNFQNCNNFGPRVHLVAASGACGTGATANTSGAAGLVHSAGRDLGRPLSPDAVRGLLVSSVWDVNLTAAESTEQRTYPSKPGYDAFYGWGRLSVGRAVDALANGMLPPEISLGEPQWFSWVDPDGGPVEISGSVIEGDGSVASWTVRMGQGAEPSTWTEIGSGTGPVDGVIATLDPSTLGDQIFEDLGEETVEDRMYRAHEPLVMIELTAVGENGAKTSEMKGFWVHRDPDLLPGFPLALPDSLETSAQLADLDGDDVYEVIVAASSGTVHVFNGAGEELAGFPVETDLLESIAAGAYALPPFASGEVSLPRQGVLGQPAVGDIDGDDSPDVVLATLSGWVYAWNNAGERLDGYPVRMVGRPLETWNRLTAWEDGFFGAPALADADGDGGLDVIVGGGDQRLYAFNGQGELLDGYPVELCVPTMCGVSGARLLSSPAIGDVDGDGDLDAVIGSNEVLSSAGGVIYAVDLKNAEVLPGFPLSRSGLPSVALLPLIGEGHTASVAIAQLDGTPSMELFSHAMLGSGPPTDLEGTPVFSAPWDQSSHGFASNVKEAAWFAAISNPTMADITGDGVPDPIMAGIGVNWLAGLPSSKRTDYQQVVGAWNGATGATLPGFPRQIDDVTFFVAPAVAEISGDSKPEVIMGSGGHFVYAWDVDGKSAPGWPKFTGSWMIGSATIGDIDGDGYVDVVQTTRQGHIFAWSTKGRADQRVGWSGTRHDVRNTGNAMLVNPAQEGPDDLLVDAEAGCCAKGKQSHGGLLLLLLPLVWRRRRA